MSRYIDADVFEVFDYTSQDGTFDDGVQFVLEKIDEQPTANVVEVVRCKDCLFGHRCFQVINGVADSWVECINPDGLNRTVSDEGYCSASIERREDAKIH